VKLGILIPAYNAERTLPGVVARIPRTLLGEGLTVCVVNDGSRDRTGVVAAALPGVQVVDRPRNRGYGGAVKFGLRTLAEAGVEIAACVHADGQYAPEELPNLFAALTTRHLDLLQGSRIASGTALAGGMPRYKYLAGLALTAIENRTIGAGLTDYASGYLVYGPRALATIPFASLSDGFEFDLEVIACARARGLAIGERPIPTHYGAELSYLNPFGYGLRVLGVVARYSRGHYHRLR
jgi:glycosyltransferase involved in cell wall biosynthesis